MSSPEREKVVSIVAAIKRVPADQVTPESSLEQLGFDSLDRVNLLFELESAFNIDIPEDVAASIRTVGDILSKLEAIGAKLPLPAPGA